MLIGQYSKLCYWNKFDMLQDQIDQLVNESEMESEISYRGEFETNLISVKSKLMEMKIQFNKKSTSFDPIDFINCNV